ncbi:MAG: hypothetical protein WC415_03025 [Patescibacteria group bacterium]|jgi:hypothetical protein
MFFKNAKKIILALLFLITFSVFAQNSEKGATKHQNNVNFDAKTLSGLVNNDNCKFRNMFYSELDRQIIEKRRNDNPGDEVENIIEEFENNIDYSLGIDFPENKRILLRNCQKEMLKSKKILDDAGEPSINIISYREKICDFHDKYLLQVSKILNDEEFEALFQIKKNKTKGVLKNIIEQTE